MAESSQEVTAAYARHEQEIGLQRLRLGCWIALALTPPGAIIDFLYYADKFPNKIGKFLLIRLVCSAAILPILDLASRPFGARHFRLLGILLAVAPAFCMAWLIREADGAESPYYAGLTLVLLGIGMVMQWNFSQSLTAAVIIFVLYLGAVLPLRHPDPESWLLSAREIQRPWGFAMKLRDGVVRAGDAPQSAAAHIAGMLSPRTRELLRAWRPEEPASSSLTESVVRDLNETMRTRLIHDPRAFAEIPLRVETLDLLESNPGPRERIRLNRLLLEDAFPRDILRAAPTRQIGIFLNNLWFMLLTAIIVIIGSHVSARLRYSDFVSRFNLDQSRRELEIANDRLGESNERLEKTNQRLRELDELKGRFFANISHELRTPLTLLLGPLEHLANSPVILREERLREYVGTMQDNGLRLLKLINDLLDLVRLDVGQLRLHKVRLNVTRFTSSLLNSVRRFAEDRGLRVSSTIDPSLTHVVADPDKLEKVLLNLLFNSIKFTPAGGEIRLNGYADGDYAVFEVIDTGMGITPENLSQLFQRFWQADTSAQRKYQGAGIGLALVKELVEAHGGDVSASSEVGRGTTMRVRIPRSGEPTPDHGFEPQGARAGAEDAEDDLGRDPDTEPMGFEARQHIASLYKRAELHASITPLRSSLRPWDPGRGGNKPEILIVDDEPDMLRFLVSQLEDDYVVREGVDGEQATALAAQYLPDAIVCDMMLPEKDGLQVCREIRANHTTRTLPFLILTARADDETKLTALAAGASDFLAKPFSTAELKLRLKNLVDAHRLQKELARQNRKLQSTLEELRETEMQLVQAEKMASLGRLSAGIIHEINNPLNFARTGLHIVRRHAAHLPESLRSEFEEVLNDISEGIVRVSTIVGDLRQFSHPEAAAVSEVDIHSAIDAALRFLSGDWRDGRVEIINEIPDGFTVHANRNKLVQVLLNLCQNSFDAMREKPPADGSKPTIVFRAWKADGRRYVSVRDNGPGIPSLHLDHIFDPFYTTKEVGKGMGLGLSICYRIIEEVGGRITVKTEHGRFCEFTLDFPDRFDDKQSVALADLMAPA